MTYSDGLITIHKLELEDLIVNAIERYENNKVLPRWISFSDALRVAKLTRNELERFIRQGAIKELPHEVGCKRRLVAVDVDTIRRKNLLTNKTQR